MNRETKFEPITFVIPAHNEAKYLPKTLQALTQANLELGTEFEVIVVNDNSSDATAELARSNNARVIDVNLRNIGAVRNAGANEAAYNWLIFVDADTLVPAKTLEQSLLALADGYVGGGARVGLIEDGPLPWTKYLIYLSVQTMWQTVGGWAAGCYMFCLKDKFDEFEGFNEEFFAAEEYFFSRQMKLRGKFKVVSEQVLTSPRKLHNYSVWQLFRFLTKPLLSGRKMFQSQAGLEILYEDDRR